MGKTTPTRSYRHYPEPDTAIRIKQPISANHWGGLSRQMEILRLKLLVFKAQAISVALPCHYILLKP